MNEAGDSTRDLGAIVERLTEVNGGLTRARDHTPCRRPLPSRTVIEEIVEDLRAALFPGYFGRAEPTEGGVRFHVGATLDRVARSLREQVRRCMCFVCERVNPHDPDCEDEAAAATWKFLNRLPEVRRLLSTDVQAAYDGDPAAKDVDETILCYPGVLAVTNYRIAHELEVLGVPLLGRIITESAHSATGIDIHPGATIGERFFMDHGTGIVIGETAVIGRNVRLYQGVTLGARSFPMDESGNPIKGIPRHPIVEDDVIIYGGATILGRITIGRGAVVGGNVWLTRDVPPGETVTLREPKQG
jgi:serine O-acetyltransferase